MTTQTPPMPPTVKILTKRFWKRFGIVTAIILFFSVVGYNRAKQGILNAIATASTRTEPIPGYNPNRICADASDKDARHKNDHSAEDIEEFDLILNSGCFSGYVVFPEKWTAWHGEFVSNNTTDHIGFWIYGEEKSRGPYRPNQILSLDMPYIRSTIWRFQGKGTIRYSATQARRRSIFDRIMHATMRSSVECTDDPRNNPLNLKFTTFAAELGGRDSGDQASDGGTFAQFSTTREGWRAARELLFTKTYSELSLNEAMKTWSNGGYDAETILGGTDIDPQKKVSDLSHKETDTLLRKMAIREGNRCPPYGAEEAP